MQFSVIVEGPISHAAPSEEALSELERYLKSLKRSPQFIEQLKSGTPQIVKEKLTYKQAEVISDRLMEFGLESIIDPPTKPESRSTLSTPQTPPPSPSAVQALENLKQNNPPKTANSPGARSTSGKTLVQQESVSTPVKNTQDKASVKNVSIEAAKTTKAPAPVTKKEHSSALGKPDLTNKPQTTETEKSVPPKSQINDKPKGSVETLKNNENAIQKNKATAQKKPDSKNTSDKIISAKVEPITKPIGNKDSDKKYSVSAVLTKATSDADAKISSAKPKTNVIPISPAGSVSASKPKLTQTKTETETKTETITAPKQAETKQKKSSSLRSPLNRSAEEIKSLFNLANAKNISLESQSFSKLKTFSIAALSILAPSVYTIGLMVTGIITISILGFIFGLLAKFSPMLAIVLILIPTLLALGALAVLSIPLWIIKKSSARFEEIKIQDEPKLFMLVTAVCKIINAPAPEKIYMGLQASVHGSMSSNFKAFFSFSQVLPEKTTLHIGAPLLESFSIKDFCYFTARECGRFAHPQTRRSQFISQGILRWLNNINNRDFRLSVYLQNRTDGITNEKLSSVVGAFINRIENLESIESSFFGYCESTLLKICNSAYSTASYENVIVSKDDAAIAENHLADIKDAIQRSSDEVISNIESRRFANNLSELSAYFFQQNSSKTNKETSAKTDLIRDNKNVKTLVKNLSSTSETLTLAFYRHENIEVSSESLLSVHELFKRNKNDSKQEKIAEDFLCGWSHERQFWKLPKETAIKDFDDARKTTKLNNCIEKIRYLSPDRSAALDYYYKLLKQLTELKAAKKIRSAGTSFRFQHCTDPSKDLDREIKLRETKIKEYADDINLQNCVMGERLGLGLLLCQDNKNLSSILYASMTKLHSVCEKINIVASDSEELRTLIAYKPKQLTQHYQLHIRELTERINNNCRLVQRRLSDCLFNFYDKISIDDAIADRMLPYTNHSGTQLCLDKANVTISTLSAASKHMSEIAANIAAKSESTFKIETIKKL